jgi:hypothetical protein
MRCTTFPNEIDARVIYIPGKPITSFLAKKKCVVVFEARLNI